MVLSALFAWWQHDFESGLNLGAKCSSRKFCLIRVTSSQFKYKYTLSSLYRTEVVFRDPLTKLLYFITMRLSTLALIVALSADAFATDNAKTYKHVAVFSIDGLHSSDVEKYIALRPKSTLAALLETGYEYTDCYTSAPSDSFPGTMNQMTGSSPRTTGI